MGLDELERTKGIAAPSESATATAGAYQAFRIGRHWFFTGFDEASELVDPMPVAWIPNTPSWFVGLGHSHGYIIPVVDFTQASDGSADGSVNPATSAGSSSQRTAPMFYLLMGLAQQRLGLAIHSLPFTVAVSTALSAAVNTAAPVVTADAPAAGPYPPVHGLPAALQVLVDYQIRWSDIATAPGARAAMGTDQPPTHLHHLSGTLLADWFASALVPH
jgi:chemotaxis signal transduction protein